MHAEFQASRQIVQMCFKGKAEFEHTALTRSIITEQRKSRVRIVTKQAPRQTTAPVRRTYHTCDFILRAYN